MRIKNATKYHFKSVKAWEVEFGDLKSGKVSEFGGYERINEYPYVLLKINGEEFKTYNGICGTGLQYYEEGAFTCIIDGIDFKNRKAEARLVKH